jgi:hypothetical protein
MSNYNDLPDVTHTGNSILNSNATIINNILLLPQGGIIAGTNIFIATSGTDVFISGLDSSGTLIPMISSWIGTAGAIGGAPLGIKNGNNITISTTGEVVTITGVNPSGTIFNEISNWMTTSGQPLSFSAGNNITLATNINDITIQGINPSGTIFQEVSNWISTSGTTIVGGTNMFGGTSFIGGTMIGGTLISGTTVLGGTTLVGGTQVSNSYSYNAYFLEGNNITLSTAGNNVTITGVNTTGTLIPTISSWGGTYAKSGTTPSIEQVSSWIGTTGDLTTVSNWLGTKIDFSIANNWSGTTVSKTVQSAQMGTALPTTTAQSWLGTKLDTSTAVSWIGTKGDANYATVSTWMGTVGGGGAGSMTLLATANANNSVSIEFTNPSIANYSKLYLEAIGVTPTVTNTFLRMLTSSNAGGTWWGATQYQNTVLYGQTGIGSTQDPNYWYLQAEGNGLQVRTNYGGVYQADIYTEAIGTSSPCLIARSMSIYSTLNMNFISGYMLPLSKITGLKLEISSGNISQGLFKLYGVS